MFFNTRTFFRLLLLSFFERSKVPPSQRKSIGYCFFFLTTYAALELWTAICFLIDEVLLGRYRRVSLGEPIFVIGNPRSGTTILHRILARDEERFFCFRTWEILFPSIVQKKLLSGLGALDQWLGSPLRGLVERAEARRFKDLNRFHELGLFKPEEDDKLLLHILASPDLAFLFPYGGFQSLTRFDLEVDPSEQRAILAFYARCIRRQAYFKGERRTLVSKSPWNSARVDGLQREFPGCKFIYLVRNPLDVVASIISFARAIVRETANVEPESDLDEAAYETVKFFYSHPLARLAALPPERCVIVNYEELIRQPKLVVERIYQQYGWSLTPEFETRLDDEATKMLAHKSRHRYSLDQCSVTRERIVADLRPVFERFGFDTREDPLSANPAAANPANECNCDTSVGRDELKINN